MMTPPPSSKLFTGDLSILTKASSTYKVWHAALPTIPRLTRHTLGTKIDTLFIETVELILLASYAGKQQKYSLIARASTKLDLLKFFLQVVWEIKALDNKKYVAISAPLIEVGKMLGGWRKQVESVLQPSRDKQNSLHSRWREK